MGQVRTILDIVCLQSTTDNSYVLILFAQRTSFAGSHDAPPLFYRPYSIAQDIYVPIRESHIHVPSSLLLIVPLSFSLSCRKKDKYVQSSTVWVMKIKKIVK